MDARSGWAHRENVEVSAGSRDLDLGNAEYGRLALSFDFDLDKAELQGDLYAIKWEDYVELVATPSLHWCTGARCEPDWCVNQSDTTVLVPEERWGVLDFWYDYGDAGPGSSGTCQTRR